MVIGDVDPWTIVAKQATKKWCFDLELKNDEYCNEDKHTHIIHIYTYILYLYCSILYYIISHYMYIYIIIYIYVHIYIYCGVWPIMTSQKILAVLRKVMAARPVFWETFSIWWALGDGWWLTNDHPLLPTQLTLVYIWVNYNISLTWIKAIWGWFLLLTMIPVRSQWGRYNLPRSHIPSNDHPLLPNEF